MSGRSGSWSWSLRDIPSPNQVREIAPYHALTIFRRRQAQEGRHGPRATTMTGVVKVVVIAEI